MIISVWYRVKSKRWIEFRIRANKILKEYLLKWHVTHYRINTLEHRVQKVEQQLGDLVQTALPRKEGIFYDGQVFDAYIFISDLIKSAKKRLILIDNYIDETVLTILSQREPWISATIYTNHISPQFQLALTKHNTQYPPINIKIYKKNHDRFLIIDNNMYHIGASIKDLWKKLFAFSKMTSDPQELLHNVDPDNK